jgi:hypothetical protein
MTRVIAANASGSQQEQDAGSCAETFGRRAYRAVMQAAQGFFVRADRKPSWELHLASGHPLRTVQTWFADKHQGSSTALIALLLTDAAPEVLRAIRAEAEAAGLPIPDFYDDLEMIGEVAKAMRRQKKNNVQRAALRKRLNE